MQTPLFIYPKFPGPIVDNVDMDAKKPHLPCHSVARIGESIAILRTLINDLQRIEASIRESVTILQGNPPERSLGEKFSRPLVRDKSI